MNNISANSLLHFTDSKSNLLSILRNGFYPRYCAENADFSFEENLKGFAPTKIAIPMVSFCDIPFSQLKKHTERYGRYALGLTKEWGIRNGINPVMYELPDSNPIRILRDCLTKALPYMGSQSFEGPEATRKFGDIGNEIMFFMRYIKPYRGRNWNGERFDGPEVRFYDEREWRYVPDFYGMVERNIKPFIRLDIMKDETVREQCNLDVRKAFTLRFKADDIKYVIVDKENEILDTLNELEDDFDVSFSQTDRKLLITKMLSLERLEEDL